MYIDRDDILTYGLFYIVKKISKLLGPYHIMLKTKLLENGKTFQQRTTVSLSRYSIEFNLFESESKEAYE